ncbi:NosD domain-containing protein [Jeotgalibacillus marinus]|uniref:Right-handed parallel beta-helix repeat-containing protein n=1 Tax=Jeotgalibacillus marinus TaxID=86667 RepID=A0ABV3Q0W3_9BACL
MKTSKDKCLVSILLLTFGLLFVGVVIVGGILFFNEKILMVPTDEFPTISSAVDMAVEGDIILVKTKEDGTPYEENVDINTDNIKLIGIGKVKPVIDGDVVGGIGINLTDRSGVLVQNFSIQNFSGSGFFLSSSNSNMIKGNDVNRSGDFGIRLLSSSNSNMIKGNSVNGNQQGIVLDSSNRNTLKGNNVNRNMFNGISLDSSDENLLKGNNVKDTPSFNGISLDDNSNDNDVFFNRAFGNGNGNTTFDINDQNITVPLNNFKENKCDISNKPNICN